MGLHDIDEIDDRAGFDTSRPHAAIAGDSGDARESGEKEEKEKAKEKVKKKAAPRKLRKTRRTKQIEPSEEEAEDEDATDGSHPVPDHETVQWLLWNKFAVSPEVAAAALNVSRNSGYAAIHKGDIPATRVGNRLMVPTAYLRQRLFLEPPLEPAASPKPAPATVPPKPEQLNRKARASPRR